MTVEELIIYGKKYVHSDHAKMILADLLNKNSLELLTCLKDKVDEQIEKEYKEKIELLKSNKPVQYVIGNVNFYGNKFIVNNKVLIPRFETEELIENTEILIKQIFNKEDINIIDLGCGSGCIGITLKKHFPNSNVSLVDISSDALQVAQTNAKNLNVYVNIIQNDMLEGITTKYDVIISNPPYIKDNEEIEDIVRDNEPSLALFGGIDGLDYYRKILKDAKNIVNDKFIIAFEIGDEQGLAILKIANQYFEDIKIEIKKDLQNRDRMLFIYKDF